MDIAINIDPNIIYALLGTITGIVFIVRVTN